MDVKDFFEQLDFDVLRYASNSSKKLAVILATNLIKRLFHRNIRVSVWIKGRWAIGSRDENQPFSPSVNTISQATPPKEIVNLNKIEIDEQSYVAELSDQLACLVIKSPSSSDFHVLIKFTPLDRLSFDSDDKLFVESFFKYTYGHKRLVYILTTLGQARFYGDISLKVYGFCKTENPTFDHQQLNYLNYLLQEVSRLEPSTRKMVLADYLIVFVYSALSHQTRNSIKRLKSSKREAFYVFIKTAKKLINDDFNNLDHEDQFLASCLYQFLQMSSEFLELECSDSIMLSIPEKYKESPETKEERRIDSLTHLLVDSAWYLHKTNDLTSSLLDKYWDTYKGLVLSDLETYLNIVNTDSCCEVKTHQAHSQPAISLCRHQIRMRFILKLFNKANIDAQTSPSLVMEFRQSLVYVLHETIRYLGNKEVRFLTRPLKFTKCLLLLIRYHAEFYAQVHLPTALTDSIKKAIVTNELSERQSEIENIQHTTDVYMMGFILLNIEIKSQLDSRENIINYISSLTDTAGEEAAANFKKAFALSAIFHDIALLPACSEIDETAATDFLIRHGIPKENERRFFENWSEPKKKHAVLSAYITVQQLQLQNEHYGDKSDHILDNKEVIIPAARAIIYHVCPPTEPSAGKLNDPLLSFLTLIDEVCAWEPSFNYEPMPLKPSLTDEEFNLVPVTTYHFRPYERVIVETNSKENFPIFHFSLSAEHDAIHKNCTSILRLAQTFGQLKPGDKKHVQWNPKALVSLGKVNQKPNHTGNDENYSLLDIINFIDEAATFIDNRATPLLHTWTHDIRNQLQLSDDDNHLVLKSEINPFRYVDIRDYFEEIETYISNRVHFGKGKWAIS